MKKYIEPNIEIILINEDIITSSPGTRLPAIDEEDGSWDW